MQADVKGDIYEGLLSKSAEESPKGAGQYFTPRELIKAIVDVHAAHARGHRLRPGLRAPAGFLLAAHDYVLQHHGKDLDPDQKKHLRRGFVRGWELVPEHRPAVHHEPLPARDRRRPLPGHARAWTAWPATPASGSAWS